MRIARPDDLTDLATLGLTPAEGKQLLAGVQQELVAAQARRHATRRPAAPLLLCWMRRDRGRLGVAVAYPLDPGAGSAAGAARRPDALSDGRRGAGAGVPVDAGADPETLRRHTLKIADALPAQVTMKPPPTGAEAIVVTLDSTFIRSCGASQRHLEVRIGNVETASGRRQVFGAVAKTDTDLAGLIRRSLDAVGRTEGTALTAFTDGCPGLRRILLDAGVEGLPILDWFHVAMRLRHLTQIAGGLLSDGPERAAAKAVIVEEVERLRWRLWNGKAKDAKVSIGRIRAVMHHFRGKPGSRRSIAPSRKLWTALQALDGYLVGQSDRLVDYGERHRAGLRVGTALTEGTANFLVNRRMNKSQQMRWSRRGADRLLQVPCAVYNGTLGIGLGQRFQAANDPHPPATIAA